MPAETNKMQAEKLNISLKFVWGFRAGHGLTGIGYLVLEIIVVLELILFGTRNKPGTRINPFWY